MMTDNYLTCGWTQLADPVRRGACSPAAPSESDVGSAMAGQGAVALRLAEGTPLGALPLHQKKAG